MLHSIQHGRVPGRPAFRQARSCPQASPRTRPTTCSSSSAWPPSLQAVLLVPAGVAAHPTDYLQFFAPGNREAQRPDEPPAEKKAPGGGGAELAQLTRRFMVYVHSKMMIVDDEVCFVLSTEV
jgi:phosphatidylserine/phosphatidylglycerophosphate/cardiolipin synthase-like enzyme